jgi:hypothetical protein
LLANPYGNTRTNPGAISPCPEHLAGEAVLTLRIRHTGAVGAVGLEEPRIGKAPERRLALLLLSALTLVRHQLQSFLEREDRADLQLSQRLILRPMPHHVDDDDHQRCREKEPYHGSQHRPSSH